MPAAVPLGIAAGFYLEIFAALKPSQPQYVMCPPNA